MVRQHSWRTATKCVICNKTGKIANPENPDKLMKCLNCGGYGMKVTSGKTKADT